MKSADHRRAAGVDSSWRLTWNSSGVALIGRRRALRPNPMVLPRFGCRQPGATDLACAPRMRSSAPPLRNSCAACANWLREVTCRRNRLPDSEFAWPRSTRDRAGPQPWQYPAGSRTVPLQRWKSLRERASLVDAQGAYAGAPPG